MFVIAECMSGYFGYRCRFQSLCKKGDVCDPVTGECPQGCPRDKWGFGCLLGELFLFNLLQQENSASWKIYISYWLGIQIYFFTKIAFRPLHVIYDPFPSTCSSVVFNTTQPSNQQESEFWILPSGVEDTWTRWKGIICQLGIPPGLPDSAGLPADLENLENLKFGPRTLKT